MSKNKNNKAVGGTAHTTVPVQESPVNNPEFVDAAGLQSRFGIKRSLAYALLGEGAIRGVSLRRRSQTRGKRLFCVDSVRAYLNRQLESGPKAENERAKDRTRRFSKESRGGANNTQ